MSSNQTPMLRACLVVVACFASACDARGAVPYTDAMAGASLDGEPAAPTDAGSAPDDADVSPGDGGVAEDAGGSPVGTPTPVLLGEVERACVRAGGTWRDYACACPAQGADPSTAVAAVFTTDQGGMCQPLTLGSSECMRNGFAVTLAQRGLATFRRCLRGSVAQVGRSLLQVASTFPDALASELAGWLDANVRTGSFAPRLGSAAGSPQRVIVSFTAPALDALPSTISPLPFPTRAATALTLPIQRTLYASAVADLQAVTGVARPAWEPVAETQDDALLLLRDALVMATFSQAESYVETAVLDGCNEACDVAARFRLEREGERFEVTRTRRYHRGSIADERLTVTTAQGSQLRGWVAFDLGGAPNLLATLRYPAGPFAVDAALYDRNLTQLGATTFDARSAAGLDAIDDMLGSAVPLAKDDVAVVTCEGDIGRALDGELTPHVVLGPHRGAPGDVGTSLFGWRRGGPADVRTYLDAVITTEYALPIADPYNVDHARQISRLMLGSDAQGGAPAWLRLVPLSAWACVLDPAALRTIAASPGGDQTRIVSLSAVYPVDQEACLLTLPGGENAHFLWVVASGNSGRAFDDLAAAQGCPHSLDQRGSMIVVDGAIGSAYYDDSDHGPRYSDIAADCRAESGACNGTSAAAPRVSHAAARIVQRHGPAISNQMVRAAILLSAKLPATPFPNRTGGMLDQTLALKAADELVTRGLGRATALGASDGRAILDALHGTTSYGDGSLADFKWTRLRDNGFFQE